MGFLLTQADNIFIDPGEIFGNIFSMHYVLFQSNLYSVPVAGGFLAILTTLLVDLNGVANIARSVSIWSLSVGTGMLFSVPFAGSTKS